MKAGRCLEPVMVHSLPSSPLLAHSLGNRKPDDRGEDSMGRRVHLNDGGASDRTYDRLTLTCNLLPATKNTSEGERAVNDINFYRIRKRVRRRELTRRQINDRETKEGRPHRSYD